MEQILGKTIRDLVREDHRAAAVFEKYSIDFCCKGDKPLDTACTERGVDPLPVLQELTQLKGTADRERFRPDEWDLDALADFIVNNHHRYVSRAVPVISAHVDKVLSVHGKNHPELSDIAAHFHMVADELTHHMYKEENVLFPYIKSLVAAARDGRVANAPPFGTIRRPIQMMESDHRSAGDAISSIRNASNGFSLPADACETYRVTYRELEDFERDLHQHIHLENNILFPKAIDLEDTLLSYV